MHLDEGTIHAWLDGALDAEESARVEQHVAECATCASAVAEARGLVAGASRILAALDDVPSGVVPRSSGALGGGGVGGSSTSGRSRSLWTVLHLTPARAAAAAFLIVAAGTALVMREGTQGAQRAAYSVVSRPGGAAAKLPVPATPMPAPMTTSADTTSPAAKRDEAKTVLEKAAASAAGGAEAPQRQVPAPARGVAATAQSAANASPARATPRIDVDSASIRAYVPAPAPAPPSAQAAIDSVRTRQTLEKRAADRSAVVGGALRPAAVMREAVALPRTPNYAGCYSVASRGDAASSLPKLVSLDSAAPRFGKALADQYSPSVRLFAVSAVTTNGRQPIDTASWQPLLDGVRISFGRRPIDLRLGTDSTLSVAGVAGRGYAMTLQRVDCPR